ncbi:MAG: prolipoprotein diacylglyceryl transferase [Aureliella sp.]
MSFDLFFASALFPSVYPFLMLLAIGTGAVLLRRHQRELELPTEARIAIGIAAFCGAMIGAKLPFLFVDWDRFLAGTAWFSSGKTIMCGMVGAYLAVELTKWILEIRTKTGDSFAVPVAVTVGIGRLGCLSAGCCFGVTTDAPWAMRCALNDDLLRHPTQIYESLFHFCMAGLCFAIERKFPKTIESTASHANCVTLSHAGSSTIWTKFVQGQLVKLYILAYLIYRLATEFIRPELRYAAGLTLYQWFAITCIPIFVGLWWYDIKDRFAERAYSSDSRSPTSSSSEDSSC